MKQTYIDAKISYNPWFAEMPMEYRLLWLLMIGDCDCAGVWTPPTWPVVKALISPNLDPDKALDYLNAGGKDIHVILVGNNTRWWIPSYMPFHFGRSLLPLTTGPRVSAYKSIQKYKLPWLLDQNRMLRDGEQTEEIDISGVKFFEKKTLRDPESMGLQYPQGTKPSQAQQPAPKNGSSSTSPSTAEKAAKLSAAAPDKSNVAEDAANPGKLSEPPPPTPAPKKLEFNFENKDQRQVFLKTRALICYAMYKRNPANPMPHAEERAIYELSKRSGIVNEASHLALHFHYMDDDQKRFIPKLANLVQPDKWQENVDKALQAQYELPDFQYNTPWSPILRLDGKRCWRRDQEPTKEDYTNRKEDDKYEPGGYCEGAHQTALKIWNDWRKTPFQWPPATNVPQCVAFILKHTIQ